MMIRRSFAKLYYMCMEKCLILFFVVLDLVVLLISFFSFRTLTNFLQLNLRRYTWHSICITTQIYCNDKFLFHLFFRVITTLFCMVPIIAKGFRKEIQSSTYKLVYKQFKKHGSHLEWLLVFQLKLLNNWVFQLQNTYRKQRKVYENIYGPDLHNSSVSSLCFLQGCYILQDLCTLDQIFHPKTNSLFCIWKIHWNFVLWITELLNIL